MADVATDGSPVRIGIIDDHQLLSASLAAALVADAFSVHVVELTDFEAVAGDLAEHRPQVALLDLDLGDFGSGEELLPVLIELGARVLIVSGVTDEAVVGRCLQAGAWGWVAKSASFDELLGAVLLAAEGQPVLDPAQRDRLLRAWRNRRTAISESLAPFERLSNREAAVLEMLQAGTSVERIAAESFVSESTVRTQVRAILAKLEVNSQLEAVAKAATAGWKRTLG